MLGKNCAEWICCHTFNETKTSPGKSRAEEEGECSEIRSIECRELSTYARDCLKTRAVELCKLISQLSLTKGRLCQRQHEVIVQAQRNEVGQDLVKQASDASSA